MSVTLHFVDNWELRHRVIAVLPVDDRHTGDNIVNWLLEVLDRYDFARSKVVAVVHDNGSNIVSAAKKLNDAEGWCSVRCAAHTIQLVVGAALKVDDIQQALVAARRVVEYFKRSVVATSALREKQEQMSAPCHKLVMEVSTRWNSTLTWCAACWSKDGQYVPCSARRARAAKALTTRNGKCCPL